MPKGYKLKFGGANGQVVLQQDNTISYIILFCLFCCFCGIIGGGVSYMALPKCDDEDESGNPKITCDDLYTNNSKVCFGDCKKADCCDELKCVSPERVLPSSMIVLPESQTKLNIGKTYNAVKDFDSSGNLKSDKKPSITCNAEDGWGPSYNIKRCTNEDNKWSLECDDSIEKKCANDEFNGTHFDAPKRRIRALNCEDINISESGEGFLGAIQGLYNRVIQMGDDSHQKLICDAHYSLSSGSKGHFCEFDSNMFLDKCKTSTTECRGPG